MVKLKHFYKKQTVSADNIPDGVYNGLWIGDKVTFFDKGVIYEATSNQPVVGALLCTVTMLGGKTTIEKRVSTNDPSNP